MFFFFLPRNIDRLTDTKCKSSSHRCNETVTKRIKKRKVERKRERERRIIGRRRLIISFIIL